MSMFILLPNRVNGLPILEANLTGQFLNHIDEKLQEQKLEHLIIPKFEIESDIRMMKSALNDLGVNDLFNAGSADLSGVSDTQGKHLHVSDVVHKAYIKLNEEGTEAAAATGLIDLFGSISLINFKYK